MTVISGDGGLDSGKYNCVLKTFIYLAWFRLGFRVKILISANEKRIKNYFYLFVGRLASWD